MQLRLKSKELFYSKEWDDILNALIKYFPINQQFNLYELSQKADLKYEDLITDGVSKTKQTYVHITNHLIYNDFVELMDFQNIILTDKGRQLVEYGNYNKFAKALDNKKVAEMNDLWVKKNWYWVEFVKLLIGAGLGILLTLISQH
jgi:hypothetical protein